MSTPRKRKPDPSLKFNPKKGKRTSLPTAPKAPTTNRRPDRRSVSARGTNSPGSVSANSSLTRGSNASRPSAAAKAAKGRRSIGAQASRGKAFLRIALATLIVLLAIFLIDLVLNWGKIYPGVKVGSIDLGGKTIEEAQTLIDETYRPRIEMKSVYVFKDEEVGKSLAGTLNAYNERGYVVREPADDFASDSAEEGADEAVEEYPVDEAPITAAMENKELWVTGAEALGTQLDSKAIASDAYETGRSRGGFGARWGAFFSGNTIIPWANYNSEALEGLIADINLSFGSERANYGMQIVEGQAQVIPGQEGDTVDRAGFLDRLNAAFLENTQVTSSFVTSASYAPLQIDEADALAACDRVNAVLGKRFVFNYNDKSWEPDRVTVGSWIKVAEVEGTNAEGGKAEGTDRNADGKELVLQPSLDFELIREPAMDELGKIDNSLVQVSFMKEGDAVSVHTQTDEKMPEIDQALEQLERALFATSTDEPVNGTIVRSEEDSVTVTPASRDVPATLTFDEALSLGVIDGIASYTTEYTDYMESRNHNIHLAADRTTNSIVKANGGEWSFNDTAGESSEATGYQMAGAIKEGEFVQEAGGGICQVSTTIFNAVFDSGFPVISRTPHLFYMNTYPDGRDAAVSWPTLDLKWQNDSSSDVLLGMSYTETTVTATIYGVNPGYKVTEQSSGWGAPEDFERIVVYSLEVNPGESVIRVAGQVGQGITITRTVKDKNDELLREDSFYSYYQPLDEVKVVGPKDEAERKLYEEQEKKKQEAEEGGQG